MQQNKHHKRVRASDHTVEVTFLRDGKTITSRVLYPSDPPTAETDKALVQGARRRLLCPGCSDQETQLGMCHGIALAQRLKQLHPDAQQPTVEGLQGIYPPEAIVERIDDPQSVFVGRGPPRGVPTKRVGVKTTLSRSPYANPFVVSKKGFTLGESLALYQAWMDGMYDELSKDAIQDVVDRAVHVPQTVEELLQERSDLFA